MACQFFKQFAELEARDQPLARSNGNRTLPAHLGHDIDIFWWNGFFHKQRPKWSQHTAELDGIAEKMPSVAVHHDIHIVTDCSAKSFHRPFRGFIGSDTVQRFSWRRQQDL